MPKILPVILAELGPARLVAAISNATIVTNPVNPTAALPISDHSIPAIILATNTKAIMATDIFRIVAPRRSAYGPAILVARINNETKPISPVIPTYALPISDHSIPAIILATSTNSSIAEEILRIVIPALSMLPAKPPPLNSLIASIRVIIEVNKPASPMKPCLAASGSRLPIILTVKANNSIAAPIPIMVPVKLLTLIPALLMLTADLDIKETAAEIPTNAIANAPITATASHTSN